MISLKSKIRSGDRSPLPHYEYMKPRPFQINLCEVDENNLLIDAYRHHQKVAEDYKNTNPNYSLEHLLISVWLNELYIRRTGDTIPNL